MPVAGLFESEKEHMLPLPSAAFDPVEWRSVKADRTGTVLIDSNRYLAGPKWHSMRLQAGAGVFEIELRDPDGGRTATLERVWGTLAGNADRTPRPCSRSSRASPGHGARARSAGISPNPYATCSTAWTRRNAPR